MIPINETSNIGEVFFRSVDRYSTCQLIAVPANAERNYAREGVEISYGQAGEQVRDLADAYASQGYGVGHRVGLLLGNQPEHFLHKLAMNAIGICCVPLNPDHRPSEMAYVIEHAKLEFVVVVPSLKPLLQQAVSQAKHQAGIVELDDFRTQLPGARQAATSTRPQADTIASVLYTSGTTGKPKGCLLSHRYELAAGEWYASRGGAMTCHEASDRIYNPLPLFHVNSSVFSFFCAMLRGNCQIQTDRFHPLRWWPELVQTRATVAHYIGVIIPMLLNQPPRPRDRLHHIRFALGAGADPQRHAEFEQRFGFPLIEGWGMTEMVRLIVDCDEPRKVGTRSVGRVKPGIEVRIVDDQDANVADGIPGQLLVRHSAATPRKDFFSGYLDDDNATESAWTAGWFHTGDLVSRDADGVIHFVDRRKNIIRRSGENIAAAEVEAVLQTHPWVSLAAVVAVKDDIRDEEVLACIVLEGDAPANRDEVIRALFNHCNTELSYYKTPGWLWFTDSIPTTGTQKLQKHQLFPAGVDPRTIEGMVDLRTWKKRK